MWTISELKANARSLLKNYYWKGVAVCLIAGILMGTVGLQQRSTLQVLFNGGKTASFSDQFDDFYEKYKDEFEDIQGQFESTSYDIPAAADDAIMTLEAENTAEKTAADFRQLDDYDDIMGVMAVLGGLVFVIAIIAIILSIAWSVLVTNVINVGNKSFFIESRYHDTSVAQLFNGFTGGRYSNTCKVMFYHSLYIFGWSLLFLIPGIIKTYEYYMVPYLVAENPNIDKDRAFEISRRTMNGEKFNCFVLELSFIGWRLLASILPWGAGYIFVNPYQEATMVEFYMAMKAKALSNGTIMPGEVLDDNMRANGFNNAAMAGAYMGTAYNPQDFGAAGTQGYPQSNADPYRNNMGGYQGYTPQSGYNQTQGGFNTPYPAPDNTGYVNPNPPSSFSNPTTASVHAERGTGTNYSTNTQGAGPAPQQGYTPGVMDDVDLSSVDTSSLDRPQGSTGTVSLEKHDDNGMDTL